MFSSSDSEDIEISLCLDSIENISRNCKVTNTLSDGSILKEELENINGLKENFSERTASGIILKSIKSPGLQMSPKVTYERKFPGPAGLFLKRQCLSPSQCINSDSFQKYCQDENEIRSQKSAAMLDNAPWQYFYDRIDDRCKEIREMLEEFSISSLKRMTMISRSSPCKIPVFVAMILSVDFSVTDPAVILKDFSGEIHGTIHRDTWEKFSLFLTTGSIIFLRNVGVLFLYNSQHLNITLRNLISIYVNSADDGNELFSKEIAIDDFPTDEVVRDLKKQWNSYLCNLKFKNSERRFSNSLLESPSNNSFSSKTNSPLFTGYPCESSYQKLKTIDNRKSHLKIDKSVDRIKQKIISHPRISTTSTLSTDERKFQTKQEQLCNIATVKKSILNWNKSESPTQYDNSSQFSVVGRVDNEDLSIVTSVLEGIDADSIFSDF